MTGEQPDEGSITRAEVEQLIADAVRAERERWTRELHRVHCELLATIKTTNEHTLNSAADTTEDAIKKMLAVTGEMLKAFDSRVKQALAEDRARMLDLPPLRDRTVN